MLFILDDKGVRRELSRADLEQLPDQEVYRSPRLSGLRVGGVRLTALLDRLMPSRTAKYLAFESVDGEQLRALGRGGRGRGADLSLGSRDAVDADGRLAALDARRGVAGSSAFSD